MQMTDSTLYNLSIITKQSSEYILAVGQENPSNGKLN